MNEIRTVRKYGNSITITLTGYAKPGDNYKVTSRDGLIILAPVEISQPCAVIMEKLNKDNI